MVNVFLFNFNEYKNDHQGTRAEKTIQLHNGIVKFVVVVVPTEMKEQPVYHKNRNRKQNGFKQWPVVLQDRHSLNLLMSLSCRLRL